jgi:hypothetical protein
MIQVHGGWGRFTIRRELRNLIRRLKSLPAHQALDWIIYFREQWEKLDPGVHSQMVDWCDQQFVEISLGEGE